MTFEEEQTLDLIRVLIPNLPKDASPCAVLYRVHSTILEALSAEERHRAHAEELSRREEKGVNQRRIVDEAKHFEWTTRIRAVQILARANITALEMLRTQLWLIVGLDLLEGEEESDDLLIQKVKELKGS